MKLRPFTDTDWLRYPASNREDGKPEPDADHLPHPRIAERPGLSIIEEGSFVSIMSEAPEFGMWQGVGIEQTDTTTAERIVDRINKGATVTEACAAEKLTNLAAP